MRAFLTILIGAYLLGGCAAKPKAVSTEPTSDITTNGAGPAASPNNVDLARDEYDRAVIDFKTAS